VETPPTLIERLERLEDALVALGARLSAADRRLESADAVLDSRLRELKAFVGADHPRTGERG